MTVLLSQSLDIMMDKGASDLYLTVGYAPVYRVHDKTYTANQPVLAVEDIEQMVSALLNDEQHAVFHRDLEYNLALNWQDASRFRVNFFWQQQLPGIVVRQVRSDIPDMTSLGLPALCEDMVSRKKGLIIVSGASGSGKTTTLASMLQYRNRVQCGHIVTVEDPIEFVHTHAKSLVTQREVGVDTDSFAQALKNALRQKADVIAIGEIRDSETMEHALHFAETGHLCIATIHAVDAPQTIQRMLNVFDADAQRRHLGTLAQHLLMIMAQRLVRNVSGDRSLITEVLLNEGGVRTLIEDGDILDIKEAMLRHTDRGMCVFDESLIRLFERGVIDEDTLLCESDSTANVKLKIQSLKMQARLGDQE